MKGEGRGAAATVREYLKLGRIHSSILLGIAPIFGALVAGGTGALQYALLFLVGLGTHIYGFGLNDLEDIEVDRASDELGSKPLVSGGVSPKGAKAFVFGGLALSFVLLVAGFPSTAVALVALHVISIIVITVYDKMGKRIPFPDFLLSACTFLLVVMGAIAAGGSATDPLVLTIALYAYVMGVLQNIIAGLKDADHDPLAGAKTTVLRLGTRIDPPAGAAAGRRKKDRGGRKRGAEGDEGPVDGRGGGIIHPGEGVIAMAGVLKGFQISLALLPWHMGWLVYPGWVMAIIMFLVLVQAVQLGRVLCPQPFDRTEIKRRIGFHEMATYFTAPMVFIPLLGIPLALFLALFPIFWLGAFLMVQYGELMADV